MLSTVKEYGLQIVVCLVIGAYIYVVPLFITLVTFLAWSFISIGWLILDGYMRFFTGIIFGSVGFWNIVSVLPSLHTEYVAYAQMMINAHIFFNTVMIIISVLLVTAGFGSIKKAKKLDKIVGNDAA